jgi:hypothetical protein
MPFFLGSGKPALVNIGNPNDLLVLGFDEITLVGKALQAIRACECDGGVEGGVLSSSESEQEEVSKVKEGVRESGGLAAGGNDGSVVGKGVVLDWRFGSAAILRLRGLVEDFADETISVFGDWGSDWGKPDMLAVTGDKTGDGSGFLDLGIQVYLRSSCGLRPASEVVTDSLLRRAVNTSTLQFTNGFLFLADGVSLNCVTRVF